MSWQPLSTPTSVELVTIPPSPFSLVVLGILSFRARHDTVINTIVAQYLPIVSATQCNSKYVDRHDRARSVVCNKSQHHVRPPSGITLRPSSHITSQPHSRPTYIAHPPRFDTNIS